ncbi:Non-specific serine/threonine protein kinase [Sulfidibacter corallicola]|uniref:Protein kinase n=1 Tax=Sulfidibacter corallicola TaxID=2818388 RepID=A0A8A4TQA9_SULCO|nr:serine/threonine-protein kinase [Sulfidibacter corallicola]QTD51740.1 protein kinase [Sulfidibacter corallicola]
MKKSRDEKGSPQSDASPEERPPASGAGPIGREIDPRPTLSYYVPSDSSDDAVDEDADSWDDGWLDADGETIDSDPEAGTSARFKPQALENLPLVNHYQLVKFLGSGAMGHVYQAYDQRLKRAVAIKFLHCDEPEREVRFIREARAQARVDHPNVCKVYEIGDWRGRPYIVMQLIRGKSLREKSSDMTLEQILIAVMQAAEGMHEAHRVGLVHRDLKPGNIMIEQGEDGSSHAYVVDFGVARAELEQDLTLIGQVLGTPNYMAPEQARGDRQALDRRTDVYALGATLFRLLTGKPPFGNDSLDSVLAEIITKEPPKPRLLNKNLPVDLETIILKCLHKDPVDRYASSRDLAEDLDRFLNGDPIVAQPMGRLYLLGKWVGKHRLPVGLSLTALVLVSFTMAWGAWQGAVREERARTLTTKVMEIEAMARQTYLSRRHDIRSDLDRLRQQMANLEADIRQYGAKGHGPGYYALGRSALSLGEPRLALDHLETAWVSGYREPRVAYALGLAYCELYRQESGRIQLIEDREERAARMTEVNTQFRTPARKYMSLAKDAPLTHPDYLEALIAYCDGRYEQALALLRVSKAQAAWFYEAHKLEADTYRDWARAVHDEGDTEGARTFFDKALTAYDRAIQIGQSDPEIYRAQMQTLLSLMNMEMFAGTSIEDYGQRCLQLAIEALEVQPRSGQTWLLKAKAYRQMAQRRRVQGEDPLPFLKDAAQAVTLAQECGGPPGPLGLESAGIYRRWAQWLNDRTQSPEDMIRLALAALDGVPPDSRDFEYYHSRGSTYRILAKSLVRRGIPACDDYRYAVESYRRAMDLRPNRVPVLSNLALCLMALSGAPDCSANPIEALSEAASHLERAVALQKDHVVLRYYLGRCYMQLAQDGDPQSGKLHPRFAYKALAQYRDGLARNPKFFNLYNVLGQTHLALARSDWEQANPPGTDFEAAMEAYRAGLILKPQNWRLQLGLAYAHFFRGKYHVRHDRPSAGDFEAALSLIDSVLARVSFGEAHLCRGSVHRLQAERELRQAGNPEPYIRQAAAAFHQVLGANPNHPEAFRSLARLTTLHSASNGLTPAQRRQFLGEARVYLDRALTLHPDGPYFLLAEAQWYLQAELAEYDAPHLPERGLSRIDQVLRAKPCLPEALALETGLTYLLKARETGDPDLLDKARAMSMDLFRGNNTGMAVPSR